MIKGDEINSVNYPALSLVRDVFFLFPGKEGASSWGE